MLANSLDAMSHSSRPDSLRVETTARAAQHPERSSLSPSLSLLSMPVVSPEPAYIAAAAAANVVTSEIISEYHISFPQDHEHEGASVTPGSLSLINAFLDRLLFNFLSCAHSTSLASLRPAVTDVLRPRLAREAIGGADEELQEYLGGDIEELNTFHGGAEPSGDWDLDVVWKRTRLRCMLYTRLGDMEEEDEEMYLEQENLNGDDRSLQRDGGMVSPAVAIFLTSVLEFVGEHALMIAAQAAYKRHETRARIEESGLQKVTVEEVDMEKVALNSTLGRLWRSWRASVRSPRGSLSRIPGMGSRGFRGFSVGSRSSIGTSEKELPDEQDRVPSVAEVLGGTDPSTIPLPSTDHDVAEIEVPGYSANLAQRQKKAVDERGRPLSMFVRTDVDRSTKPSNHLEVVASDEESTPRQEHAEKKRRPRAHSLPTPETPFFPSSEYPEPETQFVTPDEELPATQELRDTNRSVIDMAGNSIAEFGDYAIPKASSAPTSPYQGSEFNATYHIAHEYEPHPRGSYIDHQSEGDPTEGTALVFERAEYKITDSERTALTEQEETQEGTPEVAQGLHPSYGRDISQPPVSPLIGDAPPGSGRVSPVEHVSIPSGEVSPIEPSDDEEEEIYIEPTPLEDIVREDAQKENVPEAVRSEPSQKQTPRDSPIQIAQIAKIVPKEGVRQRDAETVIPEYTERPTQGRQRAKAGPTENDYTKEENREAFVVPEDFSVGNQFPDGTSLSRRPLPPDAEPSRNYRNAAADTTAAASMLPVKESREHPPEIPEKPATPLTSPTQLARKAVPHSAASSSAKSLPQPSEPNRHLSATSINATQRTPSVTVTNREESYSGRTSDVEGRLDKAPASTKARGRVDSAVREQNLDAVPSRSSSDLNRSWTDEKYSRSSTSNSDHQKNFEQLIESGKTLQYTLTPQNMREIEVSYPPSPNHSGIRQRRIQERGSPVQQKNPSPAPVQIRSRGTSLVDRSSPNQTRLSGPSPTSMNGLKSHPVRGSINDDQPDFVIRSGPAVKRGPQMIAEDARMKTTNTSDLKDFFRSTGPDLVDPRAAGSTQQPARQGPKAAKREAPPVAPPVAASPSTTASKKPRLKFEPREPTRQGNDTSSLAEFFRNGPPGAQRVPDANDATVRPQDTHSIVSTQDSFITKSVQSSTNSRVGLLDSSRNAGRGPSWEKRGMPSFDEPMAPVRKQRRVRDPYAIDSDEDEDDEDVQTPRGKNEDNQESLLDFLRSEPPPGANTTPPPLDLGNSPARTLQRKPSGPSMRSRFVKGVSKTTGNRRGAPSPSENASRGNQEYDPIRPMANDPHLYSRFTNGPPRSYSGNPPVRPRNTSLGATGAPTARMNNVRAARKQARDSRDNTNSVRELADFLRNTAPPPSPSPLPPLPQKEEGGFSRMFSRRKKSAAVS